MNDAPKSTLQTLKGTLQRTLKGILNGSLKGSLKETLGFYVSTSDGRRTPAAVTAVYSPRERPALASKLSIVEGFRV